MGIARRAPRARSVAWRMAIANLHRPGALTPSVVISLGLGLAVLVTLALVDTNLRGQLHPGAAGATPSFYFLDVRSGEITPFLDFLAAEAPGASIAEAPMMRGRIVKIGDVDAADFKARESAAWVLEGDRGVTFADAPPPGSEIVAGKWWDRNYKGPPLVSLEAEVAAGLGLHVGDSLTVNVLGRNIRAEIANLRKVNWRNFAINFVLVFSPNTFAGAPHSLLVTAAMADGSSPRSEIALLKATARQFPAVSAVRVREALEAIEALVGKLAEAIRAASSVALGTSVLVLGRRARRQQARAHGGRGHFEDSGRDPRAPDRDLSDRIRDAGRRDSGVRRRRGHAGGLCDRRQSDGFRLRIRRRPSVGRRRRRPGAHRRFGHDRRLAHFGTKTGRVLA